MHEVSRSRIVKSVCSILHSGSHSIFPYRFGIDETDDDEQVEVARTALQASFIPNVSDVPLPRLEPARREEVEREEA